jgi:hypothetical protein
MSFVFYKKKYAGVLFFFKKKNRLKTGFDKKAQLAWLGLKTTRLGNPGKRQLTLGQAQGSRVEPSLSLSSFFSVFNFNFKTVFL